MPPPRVKAWCSSAPWYASTVLAKLSYSSISTYSGMSWSPAYWNSSVSLVAMDGGARMSRTTASGNRSGWRRSLPRNSIMQ